MLPGQSYGLEDIPESVRNTQERFNWVEENWAKPCEYNSDTNTDTGNEWIEVEAPGEGVMNIRFACVGP